MELVMAASLLGLAVSGVMSMIGSGRQLELENNLRRQALTVASGMLEDSLYHYSKFAEQGLLPPEKVDNFFLMADSVTPVPATKKMTIGSEKVTQWYDIPSGGHSGDIPYRRIESTVTWTWAGKTGSVRIGKTIAEAETD